MSGPRPAVRILPEARTPGAHPARTARLDAGPPARPRAGVTAKADKRRRPEAAGWGGEVGAAAAAELLLGAFCMKMAAPPPAKATSWAVTTSLRSRSWISGRELGWRIEQTHPRIYEALRPAGI